MIRDEYKHQGQLKYGNLNFFMFSLDEDSALMTEQAQMESESKRCHHLCPQQPRSSSIPLLLLVKQILKNAGLQTTACLRNHQMLDKDLNSNLNLLLRFQRLLFIQLFEEIKSFSR